MKERQKREYRGSDSDVADSQISKNFCTFVQNSNEADIIWTKTMTEVMGSFLLLLLCSSDFFHSFSTAVVNFEFSMDR